MSPNTRGGGEPKVSNFWCFPTMLLRYDTVTKLCMVSNIGEEKASVWSTQTIIILGAGPMVPNILSPVTLHLHFKVTLLFWRELSWEMSTSSWMTKLQKQIARQSVLILSNPFTISDYIRHLLDMYFDAVAWATERAVKITHQQFPDVLLRKTSAGPAWRIAVSRKTDRLDKSRNWQKQQEEYRFSFKQWILLSNVNTVLMSTAQQTTGSS